MYNVNYKRTLVVSLIMVKTNTTLCALGEMGDSLRIPLPSPPLGRGATFLIKHFKKEAGKEKNGG
jgi:hypothetical protein